MRAYPPLPVREDWTPSYLRARHDANRDFAFNLTDAQGAPSSDGRRYHSAVDWFAPGGTPVGSPVAGRVYQVDPSRGNTGQVFGGVVRVIEPNGTLWVMRHIEPALGMLVGREIPAGWRVGAVTPWRNGGPHLHLEIWRTPTGGYRHENMIDPRGVEWTTAAIFERPEPLPYDGSLRLALNGVAYAGWDEVGNRLKWIAVHGLKPDAAAVIAWRGHKWHGPVAVTNVARHLVRKYLDTKESK